MHALTRSILPMALVAVVACRERREPTPQAPAAPAAEPAPAPAPPTRTLVFGKPPHLPSAELRSDYEPLVRYLGAALGEPVRLRIADSYGALVDELAAGSVDLAMLPAASYVAAKDRLPSLQLIASIIGEGSPRYRGYIVVPQAKPWQSLTALRGKRFAFVDRGSGSGYVFPLALLRESGLEPARDFREVLFAGTHPKVVEWVLSGRVDAGAISSCTMHQMRSEGVAQRLRVLAKTDWIPFDSIVAHPSVPKETADRLRRVLLGLSMRTSEGRAVLTGITTTNGFVAPDDSAYDPVRAMMTRVGAR